MNQRLAEIIDHFLEEYQESSPRMKVLGVLAPVVLVFVVFFFVIRGCRSGPSYTDILQRELGFIKLTKTDEAGDNWEIDLLRDQRLSDIRKDMQHGEPLIATLDVQPKDDSLSIGLNVTGQAQEKYVGGARKNGVWQDPPAVNIYNSGGKMIHSGKFEYG